MRFSILSDADDETALHEIIYEMRSPIGDYFSERFYDDSGINITIILMCRDPHWNFKQRIRFSKTENKLYMDIMLDWIAMTRANPGTRKRIVAETIVKEVPQIVAKYKFKDFDLPRFLRDLQQWFEQHGWADKKELV